MKINNKIGGIAQKIISTVFLLATFILLLYWYSATKYLPLFLSAMVVILPVAVNVSLQLFACRFNTVSPEKVELDAGTKKIKKIFIR